MAKEASIKDPFCSSVHLFLSLIINGLVCLFYSLLPNFFALFLLKKLSPVLPDAYFAAYYFNGNADVIGTKGKERWRACLLDTETSLPMSVGMMFTKATIADKTVNEVA